MSCLRSIFFGFLFCLISLCYSTTYTIPNSGSGASGLQMEVDRNGNGIIVWKDSVTNEIKFSFKPTSGFFSSAAAIGTSTLVGEFHGLPFAAFDNLGNALVVWRQTDSLLAYSYRPKGANSSFGAVKTVAIPGSSSLLKALKASPDGSFLVMLAINNGVLWSTRPAGVNGTFSTMQNIDTNAGERTAFTECSITFDPSGNALALFANEFNVNSAPTVIKYAVKPQNQNFGVLQQFNPATNFVISEGFGAFYNSSDPSNYWFIGWDEKRSSPASGSFKGVMLNSSGAVTSGPSTFYSVSGSRSEIANGIKKLGTNKAFMVWVERENSLANTGVLSLPTIGTGSFAIHRLFDNTSSIFLESTDTGNGKGFFSYRTNQNVGSLLNWGSQKSTQIPIIQETGLGEAFSSNSESVIRLIDPTAGVVAFAWLSNDFVTTEVQVNFNLSITDLLRMYGNVKPTKGVRRL
ncbi:MAG: hypothetical protein S4CHLAM37_12170 [Chlamydiia bacterium]|nr:hypothetical protein [Chlamydiia bacterium]